MSTERCPCCGQIICECDDWEDDYYDEDDYDEKRDEELCEIAENCTCGAWQFNSKGEPVHIADCYCGAE